MGDNAKPQRDGKAWSREELILAFDLYCRVPFSKTKANNPQVVSLSRILGRTPASESIPFLVEIRSRLLCDAYAACTVASVADAA
jgi:hypothetical protein